MAPLLIHTVPVNTSSRKPPADFDALVIGAGHNGLVCACYLARAGLRVAAEIFADRAYTDAGTLVPRREAGAVLLGKTNTPEFGCKGETNSPLTGLTRNPWNPAN